MPNVRPNALDQSENGVAPTIEKVVGELSLSTKPVLICGVNRKVNTGNFENIDVYSAISIPLDSLPTSPEELREMVAAAAQVGFDITSGETLDRYKLIKDLQKGGR